MKRQIRRGVFETNSSSIHSISIINENSKFELPQRIKFEQDCFGWDFETYTDTDSKASYFWTAFINYVLSKADEECTEVDEVQNMFEDYITTIKDMLNEVGVVAELDYDIINVVKGPAHWLKRGFYFDAEFKYVGTDDKPTAGYIDHSEGTTDFVKALLEDKEMFYRYLFDSRSYVSTGNDNSEYDGDIIPNYGDSTIFEKGN